MRDLLFEVLQACGGLASRRELEAGGVSADRLDVAAYYGRRIVRVRHGWFALADECPAVLRAWRVGGRLTCISALAWHQGVRQPPVLHVEVPRHAARLRDPDDARRRLTAASAVVVHWPRIAGSGDRRSVGAEDAVSAASACGVRAGGSRSQAAAVSRSLASRIV